jgi:hypothetical protein
MEGPYALDLSLGSGGVLRVCAIERKHVDVLKTSVDVRSIELAQNVFACGEEILTACRARDHLSDDVDRLQAALRVLGAYAKYPTC